MAQHLGLDLPGQLLADGFDRVHENVHAVCEGLDAGALSWRPAPGANPVGWLVWHLTRVMDDHVCGVAEALGLPGGEQRWLADGWCERLALPYPPQAHGYGHTAADVAAFAATADDLLGYHDAVHAHTLGVLATLADHHYAAVVDPGWDPPVTAAVRLVSVLDDAAQHVGQAAYVKGLLG